MTPTGNLFLVGPMGAGKSTLGRLVAARLGLRCVDLDAAIEAAAGRSIAAIFAADGEAAFRRLETLQLERESAAAGIVLACGGGVVLAPRNRALLRARGFVVHLQLDVTGQLQRLRDDGSRPLLRAPDPAARLEALAQARAPLYAEVADLVFPCAAAPAERNAAALVAALAEVWPPARAEAGA